MLKGLKSLITGIIAGTALGVLFSPEKGEKIRKDFKSELNKGGSGLKTVKDTLSKMGKELGETGHVLYDELSENETYKDAENTVKKKVGQQVKRAKKVVKKSTNSVKKKLDKVVKKSISPKTRKKAKSVLDKVKSQILEGMED